jgi:hypothetical protein
MKYPIGTLIENPAALPHPRPPLMKRMCVEVRPDGEWCALVLGWVVCVPDMAGEISHGICEPCAMRWLQALDGPAAVMAAEYTLDLGARQPRAAQAATPAGFMPRRSTPMPAKP